MGANKEALGLNNGEVMQLLSMASHVVEDLPSIMEGLNQAGLVVEAAQLQGLLIGVIPILARVETEYPGVVSLPKDGRTWTERSKDL